MVHPSSATATAIRFRFYLFGDFRIESENCPIHLPRHKVELLLAYLLLYPEKHSREKLATRFWGDFSDAEARLPTVAALAEQLAVGQASVREAYRILESMGILEVTQGRGTFVSVAINDMGGVLRHLQIDITPLIQKIAPLDDGPQLFQDLAGGKLEAVKVILKP